jgi:hypothetical protein
MLEGQRRYYFGIRLETFPSMRGKKRALPFVTKEKSLYPDIVVQYTEVCWPAESYTIHANAKYLAAIYNGENPEETKAKIKEFLDKQKNIVSVNQQLLAESRLQQAKAVEAVIAQDKIKDLLGKVATHYDNHTHHSVILDCDGMDCLALFYSSTDHWNEFARRATKDEMALAGFVSTRKTYLAPVVRPNDQFYATEVSITEHQRERFLKEFSWEKANRVTHVASPMPP